MFQLGQLQRLLTGFGDQCLVTGLFDHLAQAVTLRRRIIDNQYLRHGAPRFLRLIRPFASHYAADAR